MKNSGDFGSENAMSRWREAGRASLRWGSGPAWAGRTFDEDLALLERQTIDALGSAEGPSRLAATPGAALVAARAA